MCHDGVGKEVGRIANSRQKNFPPQDRNLKCNQSHNGQVDEPDKRRGTEMQEEVQLALLVLESHGGPQAVKEPGHYYRP